MRGEWIDQLRPRLAALQLSAPREVEIIEELSQHLDDRYEELLAAGMENGEARRLAIKEDESDAVLPVSATSDVGGADLQVSQIRCPGC